MGWGGGWPAVTLPTVVFRATRSHMARSITLEAAPQSAHAINESSLTAVSVARRLDSFCPDGWTAHIAHGRILALTGRAAMVRRRRYWRDVSTEDGPGSVHYLRQRENVLESRLGLVVTHSVRSR